MDIPMTRGFLDQALSTQAEAVFTMDSPVSRDRLVRELSEVYTCLSRAYGPVDRVESTFEWVCPKCRHRNVRLLGVPCFCCGQPREGSA